MPLQEFNPDIEVKMPKSVYDQIEYLCSKISRVEWSGILFYSIEGDITDPKNFKIKLEDILPMDKGTSAYTEYELDGKFVDYMMDNPHAMEWKIGHIHSHNTMDVFFSGTDMSELNDNAPNHNYYLSLIVNNFMEFEAKVAYMAATTTESIEVEYKALNSAGEQYTVGIIPLKVDQKLLCVHDCKIIAPTRKLSTNDVFMKRVAEIMKPKTPKTGAVTVWDPVNKVWIPKEPVKQQQKEFDIPVKHLANNPLANPNLMEDNSDAEVFLMTLLNFTNPPDVGDTIDSLLEMIDGLQIQAFELATSVSANYNSVYEALFGEEADETHFQEMLDEVIEEAEHYVQAYPIIEDVTSHLKQIRNQFEMAMQETDDDVNLIEQ